jgi:hypothetical protein
MDSYWIRESVKNKLTDLAIWAIKKLNRHKSWTLAYKLHKVADHYDNRPTGQWE